MDKIISKNLFVNLIRYARQQGINLNKLPVDISADSSGENEFIAFNRYALVFEYLLDKSGDDLLGLHIGEQYNMAALGLVGQIIQASRTIREGLERGTEYFNLISNVLQMELSHGGKNCSLVFKANQEALKTFPATTKHLIISSMVFAYREIFFLTIKHTLPVEVTFDFDMPHHEEFKRVFRQTVKFNSKGNVLTFDNQILSEKIIFSDYELLMVMEGLACKRLEENKRNLKAFSGRLKSLVYALIDPRFPTLSAIAGNLNMSERNVQRRLKAEGMSYSELILSIKKEIALEYLKKDLSIKEISYLLGYSEASAFVNAFRGWFNDSPASYRQQFRNEL
jgi:AraC-like DNA-binding protein